MRGRSGKTVRRQRDWITTTILSLTSLPNTVRSGATVELKSPAEFAPVIGVSTVQRNGGRYD
jgi:hypothetical protein